MIIFKSDVDSKVVEVLNCAYNPTEPEDPVFNPRFSHRKINHQLLMSEESGKAVLEELGIKTLNGTIKKEDVKGYLNKISRIAECNPQIKKPVDLWKLEVMLSNCTIYECGLTFTDLKIPGAE